LFLFIVLFYSILFLFFIFIFIFIFFIFIFILIFIYFYPSSYESETGDERDIIKVVQKCLNKAVAQRTISKQEAMCELAKLPLVICLEIIETVSLSGYNKVQLEEKQPSRSILSRYKHRIDLQDFSLHQFFHQNHL
jgi:hypothetical protein